MDPSLPHDNNVARIITIGVVTTVTASLAVALRLYTRLKIVRLFGIEDIVVVISLVLSIITSILVCMREYSAYLPERMCAYFEQRNAIWLWPSHMGCRPNYGDPHYSFQSSSSHYLLGEYITDLSSDFLLQHNNLQCRASRDKNHFSTHLPPNSST